MRLILASASPRRRQLFSEIVPEFEVVTPNVDEEALTNPDPWDTAKRLAETKALAVFEQHPDATVIGGDTVVAFHPEGGDDPEEYLQLSKPKDSPDAERILSLLSGREHVVITGMCIASVAGVITKAETTRVKFRRLSPEEIKAYVATGEPMDKAGAYAIQDGAKFFVDTFRGSWSNVVGLPQELLREMLGTR